MIEVSVHVEVRTKLRLGVRSKVRILVGYT